MKSILPFSFLLWIVFLVLHNSLSNPRPFRFFLCYLSFVVSRFTFRSRIHFELIFVESVRAVSRFIFWFVDVFSFIFNTLSEEVFKLLNNVSHPSSSQFSWSLKFLAMVLSNVLPPNIRWCVNCFQHNFIFLKLCPIGTQMTWYVKYKSFV